MIDIGKTTGLENRKMKSGRFPNLNEPVRTKPVGQMQGRHEHKAVLACLILIFVISAISFVVLAMDTFRPQITAILQQSTPTPTPVPTPQCEKSTLSLGAYIFSVDTVAVNQEGTLPNIGGPAGTAWWLTGTTNPFIFIFTPAIHSLSWQDVLVPGDQMIIQWADCSKEEFVYTDLQPGPADTKSILEQTSPGIVVIIQPVGATESYILHGQKPELTSSPVAQPTQGGNDK